jgi:hypothetical protein
VTRPYLAIALLLALWTRLATAQTSPKTGMLEQEGWAALEAGNPVATVQRWFADFQAPPAQ